jgi:hypothetical protein
MPRQRASRLIGLAILTAAGLASCAGPKVKVDPDQARAAIVGRLPAYVQDRQGWAEDIQVALYRLEIEPTARNICAVLAVTEQESMFKADPPVEGLANIARREIEARAAGYRIPKILVRSALRLTSSTGETYEQRLGKVRTEKQLSELFDDFIGQVPLGRQLFGGLNPVRTGGPMQVSIAYAYEHAREHSYPYSSSPDVRAEVFTRRGGLYFGIAHLLDYPVSYDRMLFRFADFNAGHYASRNAAFQNAVNVLTKAKLALDGDLVLHDSDEPSKTELAIRTLGPRLELSEEDIHRQLRRSKELSFEQTKLYERVFALADATRPEPLARAYVPRIRLESAKITRRLTTDWFAKRVDDRYRKCLAKS